MMPRNVRAPNIVAAARSLDARPDALALATEGFAAVVEGRSYPPGLLLAEAVRLTLGVSVAPASLGTPEEINTLFRELRFDIVAKPVVTRPSRPSRPHAAAAKVVRPAGHVGPHPALTVRVGRVFLDMRVHKDEFGMAGQTRSQAGEALRERVAKQFRAGPAGYRDRIVSLVRRAKAAGATVVVLPTCALVYDAQVGLDAYTFDPSLIVVAGALHLDDAGGKNAYGVVFRDGKVSEKFGDQEVRWLDAGAFTVMAAIAATIKLISDGVDPLPSVAAPPAGGKATLLLDLGHDPFSGHHLATVECAVRDAETLVGAPAAAVVTSWQYAGAKVKSVWARPVIRIDSPWMTQDDGGDIVDLLDVNLGPIDHPVP